MPGVKAFCAGRQRWRRSWPGSGRRSPSSRQFWSRSAGTESWRYVSPGARPSSSATRHRPTLRRCAGTACGPGAGRGTQVGGGTGGRGTDGRGGALRWAGRCRLGKGAAAFTHLLPCLSFHGEGSRGKITLLRSWYICHLKIYLYLLLPLSQ